MIKSFLAFAAAVSATTLYAGQDPAVLPPYRVTEPSLSAFESSPIRPERAAERTAELQTS